MRLSSVQRLSRPAPIGATVLVGVVLVFSYILLLTYVVDLASDCAVQPAQPYCEMIRALGR